MTTLQEYIAKHSTRGACTCGKCFDAPQNPKQQQPSGHTANVHFFKVALQREPTSEALKKLIEAHVGVFTQVDLFDGKEHSYIGIGGWIGDQGMALMLMGMGELLGLWELRTPEKMMPNMPELHSQLAGQGMITIVAQ